MWHVPPSNENISCLCRNTRKFHYKQFYAATEKKNLGVYNILQVVSRIVFLLLLFRELIIFDK